MDFNLSGGQKPKLQVNLMDSPEITCEACNSPYFRKVTIIKKQDSFNQDKLVLMMKELNVKFPWIPMAQSMVETGHWKSNIFVENNNLFGMKEARVRVHTSTGTQYGHAYYPNWKESVYDYAFYQCRYLSTLHTEKEYYSYLSKSYAEANNYVDILKSMVIKENLKEKFIY